MLPGSRSDATKTRPGDVRCLASSTGDAAESAVASAVSDTPATGLVPAAGLVPATLSSTTDVAVPAPKKTKSAVPRPSATSCWATRTSGTAPTSNARMGEGDDQTTKGPLPGAVAAGSTSASRSFVLGFACGRSTLTPTAGCWWALRQADGAACRGGQR